MPGRADTVVLVVVVTCRPSRSTTMVARPSSLARISPLNCSHEVTSVPLNDSTSSPRWRPAALAGATGSSAVHLRCGWSRVSGVTAMTQSETSSMVVVVTVAPWIMKTAPKSRKASTRFTVGPPAITMTFFHHGSL